MAMQVTKRQLAILATHVVVGMPERLDGDQIVRRELVGRGTESPPSAGFGDAAGQGLAAIVFRQGHEGIQIMRDGNRVEHGIDAAGIGERVLRMSGDHYLSDTGSGLHEGSFTTWLGHVPERAGR
ncbi:hypothetical protein [Frateuria aurantia]|uniref:hypothetical protein n=1 Tax=Frateuria aurantia TaxID=81475 RepID=UPI00059DC29F|nr:hypothetical protein [Frateuria aurantia]